MLVDWNRGGFENGWLGIEAGVYALEMTLDTTVIFCNEVRWVGKGARYLYVVLFAKNNDTDDNVYWRFEGHSGYR